MNSIAKQSFVFALIALAFLFASPAHAQGGATLATAVSAIVEIVNAFIIPLMYALAFLFFIAGLVRYFFIESGAEGQEKGKQMAMFGLLGLAIIFSVWGLVNILLATLNTVAGT